MRSPEMVLEPGRGDVYNIIPYIHTSIYKTHHVAGSVGSPDARGEWGGEA